MIGSKLGFVLSALLLVPMGAASGGDGSSGDPGVPEHLGRGTPGIEQAGDIEHVAQVGGWAASDLEFASREVVKLSNGATGDPVCVADAAQPDGCARDEAGNVLYQKEIRDFAVAGGYGPPTRTIDITDPRNPVLVKVGPCTASQGDVQIQGNLLFIAQDGGNGTCTRPGLSAATFNGTAVLDFSNPRDPVYLSKLTYDRGSHNQTAHPTKPFVYLSDSDVANAGLGNIPIWDVSNPASPAKVADFKFGAHSPHDITFNADGSRAYVAAVSLTYILNTENPAAPTLVSVIPNEGISISHQSDPTPDGKYLLVSDEVGGGAAGVSPGGPVYVYDIREETRPVRVGAIWDDCVGNPTVNCDSSPASNPVTVPISTAHVFRINPDGYTMAIGWYKDGVHVVDFSDIRGAQAAGSGATTGVGTRVIGRMKMPNANNWSAKMWQERHPGYVFATDHGGRGFDVFYVSQLGETADGRFIGTASMRAGNPAIYAGATSAVKTEWETDCDYTPRLNGVDGWVAKVPAPYGDGTYQLTAKRMMTAGENPNVQMADIDLYFYDKNCGFLGADEDSGAGEVGDIPEGTAYVLVNLYRGANMHANLYVKPIPTT